MDDERREAIMAEARRNIASLDADRAAWAERLARTPRTAGDFRASEDSRLERVRASIPPKPEATLDTTPLIDIDRRIASAVAAERALWRGVLAELIADYDHKLARLEARLDGLDGKQRSGASDVLPLPARRGIVRKVHSNAA